MGFFHENWLWRGTQSAIFYYVSCAPCLEYRYKRQRRNEAARTEKQRAEVITTQPGQIRQPAAFQTNEAWVEEILMGPGPPKGWKRDAVAAKFTHAESQTRDVTLSEAGTLQTLSIVPSGLLAGSAVTEGLPEGTETTEDCPRVDGLPSDPTSATAVSASGQAISDSSSLTSSSSASSARSRSARPSLERRLSTAMDTLRDHFRATMKPERWNWIRYERDDEVLSGFNQTMTKMWDRATNFGLAAQSDNESNTTEQQPGSSRRRRRALSDDSNRQDYQSRYYRNAEINDLHPPTVSRLPGTRDEAAWMLLPPPSAAVMGGTVRPQEEAAMRWPLARVGRTPEEWKDLAREQELIPAQHNSKVSIMSESIPDLSDSVTESISSDEERWRPSRERRSLTQHQPLPDLRQEALDLVYPKDKRLIATNLSRSSIDATG